VADEADGQDTGADAPPSPQSVSEESAVLEVHPPHAAAHNWKDLSIQIATITIGLLIAIALEQTVEYVHHRLQAREMAARLHEESLQNHALVSVDLGETDSVMRAVLQNITALENIRASGDKAAYVPIPLPIWVGYTPQDATWLMMRDSALLPVVPDLLGQNYWRVEGVIDAFIRRKWDADASRTQLEALLRTYGKADLLSTPQRESLQRAFNEYDETLVRYRKTVVDFDQINAMALAGQPISAPALSKRGFGS
jgi:hypothetical protein